MENKNKETIRHINGDKETDILNEEHDTRVQTFLFLLTDSQNSTYWH